VTLDPRLNAFRPDLADARLSGKIEAQSFVSGDPADIAVPVTGLHRQPQTQSMMMTQALLGERMAIFERKDGWAWGQLEGDGYVGYLPEAALAPVDAEPTHRVAVPLSFLYPAADLKSQPTRPAYLNSRLRVTEEGVKWSRLADGRFAFSRHLARLGEHARDAAAVAELFANVPYLWGGKTQAGLDCSGLVQIALEAAGLPCPRDTDMMERSLGEALPSGIEGELRRGDLVFWKGHVGMMLDAQSIIHANGHHMLTVIEPVVQCVARIASNHGPVTSVRRCV
jgi:cell wall-associated NlpC family hydrolase